MILGVDPGLHNTGWAVIANDDGKVAARGVLVYPGKGKQPTEEFLRFVIPSLGQVLNVWKPRFAAVEGVSWQGRTRRIMLPLSHVAGAIIGFLAAHGVTVCLLAPTMKKVLKGTKFRPPVGWRSWSDHEQDAVLLAEKLRAYLNAESAGDASALKRLSAVGRRIITAPHSAPGSPSVAERRAGRRR